MTRLVVFTDLDGTLLDHATYSHAPANEALAELKARDIPLVLASSKTATEVAQLHAALALGATPAIVENGAGLYRPDLGTTTSRTTYEMIRTALNGLDPILRRPYRGFGDMSVSEVAEITGLPPSAAKAAKDRRFSEPGLWTGSTEDRGRFLFALAEQGIHGRDGGRFLTLSQGQTKADRLAEIAQLLGADLTLALGDAPNDLEMIEAADYGVIVRNDSGPGLPVLAGEAEGRIRRTPAPGPEGWNRAVLEIVAELLDKRQGS